MVLFRRRLKERKIFYLSNFYNTRQAWCSVANIHSFGYVEFIKQMDLNAYFAETLPHWVIAEINQRFYMPCDPASHNGWSCQCRVCGNYMQPLQEWTCVTSNMKGFFNFNIHFKNENKFFEKLNWYSMISSQPIAFTASYSYFCSHILQRVLLLALVLLMNYRVCKRKDCISRSCTAATFHC